jgi:hypothetical protein
LVDTISDANAISDDALTRAKPATTMLELFAKKGGLRLLAQRLPIMNTLLTKVQSEKFIVQQLNELSS